MSLLPRLTRRSFLKIPALAPFAALGVREVWAADSGTHHFAYDHVLGTSLDLIVRASDVRTAARAEAAALEEIRRLTAILATRDPGSEISRFEAQKTSQPSRDLSEVLEAYAAWEKRTAGMLSIRPLGPGAPRNVDALGKAYIIDRAAQAAKAVSGVEGILLNIGGDIVVLGPSCEISLADPATPQDNAAPLTHVVVTNGAVAASGGYARNQHLLDPRVGSPALLASSAVVARDAVTANALATTLCLTDTATGLRLVESTPGAEALRIGLGGEMARTSGFARIERPTVIRTAAVADWPANYEVNIALTLTNGAPPFGGRGGGRGGPGMAHRLYVAVWVENSAGKLVRVLAFWADKARYYTELASFYGAVGRNQNLMGRMARATRAPGAYKLLWDGLDSEQNPAPPGAYRIVVETNQEHGQYAKQAVMIDCGDKPATATLSATSNFEAVTVQYGPRPKSA